MQSIKKRLIDGIFANGEQMALLKLFESLFNTQNLVSPALAIKAGGSSPQFQTGAFTYLINGQLYQKAAVAANSVPAALSWPGTAGLYNAGAVLLSVDAAGNLYTNVSNVTASAASQAAAMNGIVWPWIPETQTVIGGFIVSTSAANTAFTGGTTNLDAANIAVAYFNTTGPFFPSQL
jgi:hypothetical protein